MPYNVGVVGLDDFNGRLLDHLAGADDCRFHGIISRDETVIHDSSYPFEGRLDTARERIEKIGGLDGIMTYWDFPSSSLATLLAEEYGLPYASPTAVLKCEHKLWFRELEAEILPAPGFAGFNPFVDDPLAGMDLDYPFWIKPVVGHSSMLGFLIENKQDFDAAIEEIRGGLRELTRPFKRLLEHVGLPEHLREEGADLCIAEEIISKGRQCTVEGYVHNGDVHPYGLIDSVPFEDGHTFHHYSYPSSLPQDVREKLAETTKTLVSHLGYDNCPFNVEYYYDPDDGRLCILEMNARLSQSHAGMFERVDGCPHFQIALDVCLGREPKWHRGNGDFACAGKFYLRRFEDGVVERVPSNDNLAELQARHPDADLAISVEPGERLSELKEQAADSYIYGELFLGAGDEDELARKYEDCSRMLDFAFR